MNKNSTPLVDEHLKALSGMNEAGTDEFFYTRLKARMEKHNSSAAWIFPLKPVWVIGTLTLFLALNGFMLINKTKPNKTSGATAISTIQDFAVSYDQSITSY
jgi:hypothetical protein